MHRCRLTFLLCILHSTLLAAGAGAVWLVHVTAVLCLPEHRTLHLGAGTAAGWCSGFQRTISRLLILLKPGRHGMTICPCHPIMRAAFPYHVLACHWPSAHCALCTRWCLTHKLSRNSDRQLPATSTASECYHRLTAPGCLPLPPA